MAKTGRPKVESPKDIRFTFRMDAEESEMLEVICSITGDNKNEVVRKALRRYYEYTKRTKR